MVDEGAAGCRKVASFCVRPQPGRVRVFVLWGTDLGLVLQAAF